VREEGVNSNKGKGEKHTEEQGRVGVRGGEERGEVESGGGGGERCQGVKKLQTKRKGRGGRKGVRGWGRDKSGGEGGRKSGGG